MRVAAVIGVCNWGLNKSVLKSVNLLYVLIGSIERDN